MFWACSIAMYNVHNYETTLDNMDTVQVQVQINDTKRVLFTPEPNTYTELVDVIRKEIPKTRTIDINLLYENDEGEYVFMNSHDQLCL